jgi:hypothetical protein
MVTRASEVLWSEVSPAHLANVHDFTDADIAAGKLHEADSEATAENRAIVRRVLEAAVLGLGSSVVVTEYANDLSGGWHLWDTAPYMERVAPLVQRIEAARTSGFRIRRRTVIVVDDWTEVTEP